MTLSLKRWGGTLLSIHIQSYLVQTEVLKVAGVLCVVLVETNPKISDSGNCPRMTFSLVTDRSWTTGFPLGLAINPLLLAMVVYHDATASCSW